MGGSTGYRRGAGAGQTDSLRQMHSVHHNEQGFSLIQMSALIAVGSIIMVAVLPGGSASTDLDRANVTRQHMQAIEAAMQGYLAAEHRRPCPAAPSDPIGSASFGMEQRGAGLCTAAAGTVEFAGMPPVKTLGLSNDHAFDGWGRRLHYRVDQKVTVAGAETLGSTVSSCFDLQSQGAMGAIAVVMAHDSPVASDYIMWALASHGKDKFGSYSMQGGGPLDGATDADTLKNIALEGRLVRRDSSDGFDDIVWYREGTKNTCCQGKACLSGFSGDLASAGTADTDAGVVIAAGDVNGDGVLDMVIGNAAASPSRVVVVFGGRIGWPVRQPLDLSAIAGGDGSHGFVIENDAGLATFGKSLAIGDVNGDSIDDIVIGGSSVAIVFGDTESDDAELPVSSLDGSNGLLISYGGSVNPGAVATGDLDGDSVKDIIFAHSRTGVVTNYIFVVWGRNAAGWCSLVSACDGVSLPKTWSSAYNTIAIADGFSLSAITSTNAGGLGYFSLAAGDADGNGIDDLLVGGNSGGAGAAAFLVFGKDRATWTTPVDWTWNATNSKGIGPVVSANPPVWGIKLVSNAAATNYQTIGNSVAAADLNNDGYKDLLISDVDRIYIYLGRAAGSWPAGPTTAPYDIYSNASAIINTVTNRPSWIGSPVPNIITAADINDDGRKDLLIGVKSSGTPAGCLNDSGKSVGSVYVVLQPPEGWSSANLFTGTTNSTCDANELNIAAFPGSFRIDGVAAYDYAFRPVAADINADSRTDLLIAAPGNVMNRAGSLHVLFGRRRIGWNPVESLDALQP